MLAMCLCLRHGEQLAGGHAVSIACKNSENNGRPPEASFCCSFKNGSRFDRGPGEFRMLDQQYAE